MYRDQFRELICSWILRLKGLSPLYRSTDFIKGSFLSSLVNLTILLNPFARDMAATSQEYNMIHVRKMYFYCFPTFNVLLLYILHTWIMLYSGRILFFTKLNNKLVLDFQEYEYFCTLSRHKKTHEITMIFIPGFQYIYLFILFYLPHNKYITYGKRRKKEVVRGPNRIYRSLWEVRPPRTAG